MNDSDYRAMCAELTDDLEEWVDGYLINDPADEHTSASFERINRARTLLAQPVAQGGDCSGCEGAPVASNSPCAVCGRIALTQPEPVAPTDKEIEEWADACSEAPLEEMDPEVHGWRRCFTAQEFSETIRAAIARWGRPTPQPVAVSERQPGPEDCLDEGWAWFFNKRIGWRQAVLPVSPGYTHWLPANALPTPEATND